MKSFSSKYETLFETVTDFIDSRIKDGTNPYELISPDEYEDEYTDEFYGLPIQVITDKYGYNTPYYIINIYKENKNLYFKGIYPEDGEEYTFEVFEMDLDVLCCIADLITKLG